MGPYGRFMATPALPPIWTDEPRAHPSELVHESGGRRWPWLLAAVMLLLVGGATCVGLPGSGQVRVTVSMAGGPADLSGNSVRPTLGNVEIHQIGRTVGRMTVPPNLSRTVHLRPGLYQLEVTNFPGCGISTFVLWGSVNHVDISCSVP